MLFYTQIKREFTNASWKRGQVYFREERVKNVKLDGDNVNAKIQGSSRGGYETSIVMARGNISNSRCSCPAHRQYETHCKHVAALAIWVVERGSLLRADVSATSFGVAPDDDELVLKNAQRAADDRRLRKLMLSHPMLAHARFLIRRDRMMGSIEGKALTGESFSIPVTLEEADALLQYSQLRDPALRRPDPIPGDPVLFVRGIFQGKILGALTVESGIRYHDPITQSTQINTLTFLTRQPEPGLWQTSQGVLLRIAPPVFPADQGESGAIYRLDFQKMIHHGRMALETLAAMLSSPYRPLIMFDSSINIQIEATPLKLVSLKIGKNMGKSRQLSYEFQNSDVRFTSDELAQLGREGRLSSQHVWKDNKLYRFETSLSQLDQFTNRSGVAQAEGENEPEKKLGPPDHLTGHGSLFDDTENPLHPLTVYRLSLEMGVENLEVDEDWEEFHEWRKNFEKKKIAAIPKVEYGFKLRMYQTNGLKWIWALYHRGLSALLADEMGLGKTHQVLAFLTSIYKGQKPKPKQPSLVVAPTSVIAAWTQKLKKYDTGLKWHVFHGSGRKLPSKDVDLVLTTYGLLHREQDLLKKEWHVVILDEAQAIKNAATISSRAARMLKGKFHIAMTGTPVENQSSDLWSLMEFLLPGYFGSLARFKRLYGWGRDLPSATQAGALKRLTSPFLLRRTKAQVLKELPEKTEEVVECSMTDIQKKAYRACLNSAAAARAREDLTGKGKVDYANILSLLTRLKQVCDHPKLADITAGKKEIEDTDPTESGKWEAFDELLEEALGSELKIVVFTQYLGMMDLIGHHLTTKGVGFTDLRGDTVDRGARLEKFATDPECKVFVCSLLAGGLGIDLTSASVCIHFDRWWNPAKENQATDRLHRFGQTRGVQVFKLQIPGTVEDRIASIIQSKVALSGAIIEESSVGLKTFSRKELLELLAPDLGD